MGEGLSEKWGESGSGKDCVFLPPSWKTHFKAQVVVEGASFPGLTQWAWEEAGRRRARGPLPCAQPPVTLAPHHAGPVYTVAPVTPLSPGLPSPRLAVTSSRKASRPPAQSLEHHHPLEEDFGAPLSLGWEHSGAGLL